MTVWRTTGDGDGPGSGERVPVRYDVVEHDTALLRIAAVAAAPRLLMSGEIDVSNARDVARVLGAVRDRAHGDLHVDMGAVEFIDVAGLRAFSRAASDLHAGGRLLVLHAVSAHIERLFELIGWSTVPGLGIHCRPRG